MFDDNKPIHIRELMWLAYYFNQHGRKERAREIVDALNMRDDVEGHANSSPGSVPQMFGDEKREA